MASMIQIILHSDRYLDITISINKFLYLKELIFWKLKVFILQLLSWYPPSKRISLFIVKSKIIIIIIVDDQIILAIKLSFITFDLRCRTYNWPSLWIPREKYRFIGNENYRYNHPYIRSYCSLAFEYCTRSTDRWRKSTWRKVNSSLRLFCMYWAARINASICISEATLKKKTVYTIVLWFCNLFYEYRMDVK